MRRLIATTRGRLVLTQVVVLAFALLLSDIAVYVLLSTTEFRAADQVLVSQATTLGAGLDDNNGVISFAGKDLPNETQQGIAVDAAIVAANGAVVQTPGQPLDTTRLQGLASSARGGNVTWLTFTDTHGTPRRAMAQTINVGAGTPAVLVVSRSVQEIQTTLVRTALFLAGLSIGVVFVGALLARRLAGRVLRPVRRISGMARSLSEHDLHERVDIAVPNDELGELVETFNGMLARLEASFESLRRFIADASHELRSPLTLMRTELEGTLARPRSVDQYQGVLKDLESEVESMSRVADHLLYLARADAGGLNPAVTEVDVADMLLAAAARWRKLARSQTRTIDVAAPESGTVLADEDLLRRVLDNLLENALRHSPPGGRIDLSATRKDGHWLIDVRDQGPGVEPLLVPRLFQRFARADDARGRENGGAGLGLALSQAIAVAHGGTLELVDGQGPGATFRLELPAV